MEKALRVYCLFQLQPCFYFLKLSAHANMEVATGVSELIANSQYMSCMCSTGTVSEDDIQITSSPKPSILLFLEAKGHYSFKSTYKKITFHKRVSQLKKKLFFCLVLPSSSLLSGWSKKNWIFLSMSSMLSSAKTTLFQFCRLSHNAQVWALQQLRDEMSLVGTALPFVLYNRMPTVNNGD